MLLIFFTKVWEVNWYIPLYDMKQGKEEVKE